MDEKCTLVELVGIPYSGKTSAVNEVQRQLRRAGTVAQAIQEFRGAEEFYEQRKLTPDINLLRALNFMREFVQYARDPRTSVVLVDRGLFDSYCWIKWFESQGETPSEYADVLTSLLASVVLFAGRYRLVWLDRSPIDAMRGHGSTTGRVVNFPNLLSLRSVYEFELAHLKFSATCHHLDSDDGSAQTIASSIITQLKLARPAEA